jgi:hypothetical protein
MCRGSSGLYWRTLIARGGTPAAAKVAWISRSESWAARAFGVSTGMSMLMAPVPSASQSWASPITSPRWEADMPPRPRPTNTTIERSASWTAIGWRRR